MPRALLPEGQQLEGDALAAMLSATIDNARKAKFFAERFGSASSAEFAENFEQIEPVTKDEIWNAGDSARVPCGEWRQFYTGGTTGKAFPYQVSLAEEALYGAVFKHAFANLPRKRAARLWDGGQIHGRNIPTPYRFHDFSVYTPGAFGHLADTLAGEFDEPAIGPRCEVLVGGERVLKTFALWAAQRPGLPGWCLGSVITFGTCLTSRTRNLLQTVFGGVLIDRYGASEAIGGATECSCSWYHPDPCLIVEAIAPQGLCSVKEGPGRLLLTPLFPFQQRQPLIRYDVGDLAEVTHSKSCRPGELALRPLGRIRNSIIRDDEVLLAEAEILEALDSVEGVARLKTLRDCSDCDPAWPVGAPLFKVDSKTGTVLVQVKHQPQGKAMALQIEDQLAAMTRRRTGIERSFTIEVTWESAAAPSVAA